MLCFWPAVSTPVYTIECRVYWGILTSCLKPKTLTENVFEENKVSCLDKLLGHGDDFARAVISGFRWELFILRLSSSSVVF